MIPQRIHLKGGAFWMGSNDFYPEERPVREVSVAAFELDSSPVTVAQFRRFVQETGHVSTAHRAGQSHVFKMTDQPVDLSRPSQWWVAVEGASWECPDGRHDALPDHPVVQVSLEDAKAYAMWADGRLPSEAEWEFAARGGLDRMPFAWGQTFAPEGQSMAHVWAGAFPWYCAHPEGPGTVPVGQFPPNGWGLYDMIGNCWEWTCSPFQWTDTPPSSCCSCSPHQDEGVLWALKGGSHLCAAEYCLRYRPAARIGALRLTSTSHIGFRCAYDPVHT